MANQNRPKLDRICMSRPERPLPKVLEIRQSKLLKPNTKFNQTLEFSQIRFE